MKTIFDTNRFMNLLKYEIFTESKGFARGAIGLTVGLAFYFMANLYFHKEMLMSNLDYFDVMYENFSGGAICVGFALMMVAGCSIFKNMITKQQRINFLSLPASNLEKYLARFIWVNIGYLVIFIISLCLSDILLAIFSAVLGLGVHGSVAAVFFEHFFESAPLRINGSLLNPNYYYVMLFTVFLFMQSSWTFFGALFRKNAWLWTLCLQVLFGTSWAMIVSGDSCIAAAWFEFYKAVGKDPFFWIHIIFAIAVSVLMYWGSYKLFCRMQVVNNKWINI